MTCKDCIHFKVCEAKDTEFTGLPFSIANDDCGDCLYSKINCSLLNCRARLVKHYIALAIMIILLKSTKI